MVHSLILAAALTLDGRAAREHASKLAALGPHPFGSPRGRFAAEYVAAQFRGAGLQEVRLQEVPGRDARGANVLGVLRGPGDEFVVLCAHHDTGQDTPGAYGSGGGVGILIEAARILARGGERPDPSCSPPSTRESPSWPAAEGSAHGPTCSRSASSRATS